MPETKVDKYVNVKSASGQVARVSMVLIDVRFQRRDASPSQGYASIKFFSLGGDRHYEIKLLFSLCEVFSSKLI